MPEAFDWAKFIQTYQTIVAAIIAVVLGVIGWIINYQLTLKVQNRNHLLAIKAQNDNLLNQLYNTARIDTTTNLREYELFLYGMRNLVTDCANVLVSGREVDLESLNKLMAICNFKWINILKEYQTLLPNLEVAHEILVQYDTEIQKFAINLVLMAPNAAYREEMAAEANRKVNLITNQIGLVNDLMVYLQVNLFAKITGNPVPKNLLNDDVARPKFIIRNGKLEYTEGTKKST